MSIKEQVEEIARSAGASLTTTVFQVILGRKGRLGVQPVCSYEFTNITPSLAIERALWMAQESFPAYRLEVIGVVITERKN